MAWLNVHIAHGVSLCRRHPFFAFCLLAYAFTWSFWLPVVVFFQWLLPPWMYPALLATGAFGPTLSALVLTAMNGGKAAIHKLLGQLCKWRVGFRWYLVVLLMPVALSFSALALHSLLGGTTGWFSSPVPSYLLPAYFLLLLFVGPIQEEIGWRGYALPMLQRDRSALSASLILGFLWAFWHLPLFWIQGLGRINLGFTVWLLGIIALAILFTWLYNGTQGSLLIVLLFHGSLIFTFALVPILPVGASPLRPSLIGLGLLWIVATIVIIVEKPAHLTRNTPEHVTSTTPYTNAHWR